MAQGSHSSIVRCSCLFVFLNVLTHGLALAAFVTSASCETHCDFSGLLHQLPGALEGLEAVPQHFRGERDDGDGQPALCPLLV